MVGNVARPFRKLLFCVTFETQKPEGAGKPMAIDF